MQNKQLLRPTIDIGIAVISGVAGGFWAKSPPAGILWAIVGAMFVDLFYFHVIENKKEKRGMLDEFIKIKEDTHKRIDKRMEDLFEHKVLASENKQFEKFIEEVKKMDRVKWFALKFISKKMSETVSEPFRMDLRLNRKEYENFLIEVIDECEKSICWIGELPPVLLLRFYPNLTKKFNDVRVEKWRIIAPPSAEIFDFMMSIKTSLEEFQKYNEDVYLRFTYQELCNKVYSLSELRFGDYGIYDDALVLVWTPLSREGKKVPSKVDELAQFFPEEEGKCSLLLKGSREFDNYAKIFEHLKLDIKRGDNSCFKSALDSL